MARNSKIAKGKETFTPSRAGKLHEDRTGAPDRRPDQVALAAEGFASIVYLLRMYLPAGHKARREDPEKDRVLDIDEYTAALANEAREARAAAIKEAAKEKPKVKPVPTQQDITTANTSLLAQSDLVRPTKKRRTAQSATNGFGAGLPMDPDDQSAN